MPTVPAQVPPTVCIIGGGYAGVHAAHTARAAGVDVVIVEPTGQHDLAPRLAGVASGRRPVGDAWAPLEDLVDATVVRARVTRVDEEGPVVHLDDGRRLTPDAVVVTVGDEASLPPVDGLDETSARTLKTAADALQLRGEIATAARLVVVGAGATGVQLAAEAALEHPDLAVDLVEVSDQVLGSFGRSLRRRASQILHDRGVSVHLDASIDRAEDDAVVLHDGTRLDGLVVWTTGVVADANALLPGARTVDGRLLVDRSLRVTGRVLAAGDVAAQRDVLGRVTAQSAQIALQAGRAAGRNAARIAQGHAPRQATLVDLGWVVDMGGRGVAQLGPVDVALPGLDLLVPVLHEAIDLRHLWQAGGAAAVLGHASGRHAPTTADVRRAERPALRSVS